MFSINQEVIFKLKPQIMNQKSEVSYFCILKKQKNRCFFNYYLKQHLALQYKKVIDQATINAT